MDPSEDGEEDGEDEGAGDATGNAPVVRVIRDGLLWVVHPDRARALRKAIEVISALIRTGRTILARKESTMVLDDGTPVWYWWFLYDRGGDGGGEDVLIRSV